MAADKRCVVAFHLAVLEAIEMSKRIGRNEIGVYTFGPGEYEVKPHGFGSLDATEVCIVIAPEISVADARKPAANCGWCNSDLFEVVAGFCSDECESAYNNTAGNHCELCGEYEDECVCEDRCEFSTAAECHSFRLREAEKNGGKLEGCATHCDIEASRRITNASA